MTRVLMTGDAYGGVFPYVTELTRGLVARGHEVHLGLMGTAPSLDQRAELARSGAASVATFEGKLEWMSDPWSQVDESCEWLSELARSLRPDVVHVNGYSHALCELPAPCVVVAHSCVLSWWWAVHGEKAPRDYEEYRVRVTAALQSASAVVAPSASMLAELTRWYGFEGGEVIPNCRSGNLFSSGPKEPIVLGAGRIWDKAKNLDVLARIAGRLPWTVAIAGPQAGPGAEGGAVDPSALVLGELGFDDLASFLARAAVFAAPARYEPFGLGALEAALSACALVLGDIPSLREVWEDAAIYVPPGDGDALEEALLQLIRDRSLREHLGHTARRRGLSFSPELCARRYDRLYTRVRGGVRAR